DVAPVLLHVVDLVKEAVEDLGDGDEVLGLPLLGDFEDGAFGGIQRVFGIDPFLEADPDNGRARVDQAAQRGGPLDDFALILNVDGGGHRVKQGREIGDAADPVQLFAPAQFVRKGDEVGGLTPVVQIETRAGDRRVG